jgi:rRNA maturation endonuclease Nob1
MVKTVFFRREDRERKLRLDACALCQNADFGPDASFCKKCGAPLYNFCLNEKCGAAYKDPEANFCELCGRELSVKIFREREGADFWKKTGRINEFP